MQVHADVPVDPADAVLHLAQAAPPQGGRPGGNTTFYFYRAHDSDSDISAHSNVFFPHFSLMVPNLEVAALILLQGRKIRKIFGRADFFFFFFPWDPNMDLTWR